MKSKFRRKHRRQQASLKLEGQKLFKIDNDGGLLSSFGGLPVAARIAQDSQLIQMAAELIPEWRDANAVKFSPRLLLFQRVLLASCGFPHQLDCSFFRNDPALLSALGWDTGGQLPSQSTHARMEKNISSSTIQDLEAFPLKFFFTQFEHAPRALTIYLDGTAIRTFGAQEKSTYRGGKKYSQTQYFPLIATTDAGDLLLAQLREGGHSDAKSLDSILKLVRDIKSRWPNVQLTLVMDTGFNSPDLISALEKEDVLYAIGYPCTSSVKSKMKGLIQSVEEEFRKEYGEPKYIGKGSSKLWQAEHERIRSLPAEKRMEAEREMNARSVRRVYRSEHDGKKWDKERPLIHRIDFTDKGLDIRCVVTNIRDGSAESIYENYYCRRARVETFIKENKSHCKVPLSSQSFTANQFRFTAIQGLTYMLLNLMRKELPASQQATSLNTVRKRLLLIPVQISVSQRRIHWHLSTVHPFSNTVIAMARKLNTRAA